MQPQLLVLQAKLGNSSIIIGHIQVLCIMIFCKDMLVYRTENMCRNISNQESRNMVGRGLKRPRSLYEEVITVTQALWPQPYDLGGQRHRGLRREVGPRARALDAANNWWTRERDGMEHRVHCPPGHFTQLESDAGRPACAEGP